jgi:hypothetical protein
MTMTTNEHDRRVVAIRIISVLLRTFRRGKEHQQRRVLRNVEETVLDALLDEEHGSGLHGPHFRAGTELSAPAHDEINLVLAVRLPGLPAGQSLPELLARHRGHRNKAALARLTERLILAWADAHHRHTGAWPKASSGQVIDAPGEHWRSIESPLRRGWRGLPGGDSLARLLVRHGRRPALWGAGRWTAAEDRLVRTLSPQEAARRTGRPLRTVYWRRHKLNVIDSGEDGR